jgi:hypothetical protein
VRAFQRAVSVQGGAEGATCTHGQLWVQPWLECLRAPTGLCALRLLPSTLHACKGILCPTFDTLPLCVCINHRTLCPMMSWWG